MNALFNGADVSAEISRYLALDVPMGNVAAISEERATERPYQLIEKVLLSFARWKSLFRLGTAARPS